MKISIIKSIIFLATISFLYSCTSEDDIKLPEYNSFLFREDFSSNETDNVDFLKEGWLNYNEVGSKKWSSQLFSGNGYVEFSSFGSGQAVNVGWLISPPINMDIHDGEKLTFQSAQNFLRSRANTLELLVSTNFDGVNVSSANWTNIPVKTASPDDARFLFINSGIVDLSLYTGTLHIAFKVVGSGTNSNLTGTYQIDNINLYYPSKE